ncbi:hypothetical protein [Demequina lutea]|uniref:Uncharacterized protein n=1 Tax=Demequina lutea TaxID=431489 RepID=A0A7Y9Z8V7_9MICO|nr:hypothetical protein [Demequina lutea]NYI40974.1 hypothetical protein [Demequina lutea]
METLVHQRVAASPRKYLDLLLGGVKSVPDAIHGPTVIKMDAGGCLDAGFDGERWFDGASGSSRD